VRETGRSPWMWRRRGGRRGPGESVRAPMWWKRRGRHEAGCLMAQRVRLVVAKAGAERRRIGNTNRAVAARDGREAALACWFSRRAVSMRTPTTMLRAVVRAGERRGADFGARLKCAGLRPCMRITVCRLPVDRETCRSPDAESSSSRGRGQVAGEMPPDAAIRGARNETRSGRGPVAAVLVGGEPGARNGPDVLHRQRGSLHGWV